MRKCVSAALSALPVFLLGCVFVLLCFQFRLASFQAATTGYDWPAAAGGEAASAASAGARAAQLAASQQQQQGDGSTLLQHVTALKKDTLVVYVLNEDDPIFSENFQYFMLAGVQEGSRCVIPYLLLLPWWRCEDTS